ncbi:MAG: Fpg/Nei family DNA glycosylase [Actinomycetota bacterium]
MPELPDVETFKHYFNHTSLKQKVKGLKVCEKTILKDASIQKISANIVGCSFIQGFRHGKYLFGQNEKSIFLIMHFGMTGRLEFREGSSQPKYSRFILEFDKGFLHYVCARKLGRISLTGNMEAFIKKKRLGPDALHISEEEFIRIASKRKKMIKPALMDQSFIAGLGNIYVDEVCYQCGVNPRKRLDDIEEKKLKGIYGCIQDVLDISIKAKADISSMPDSWLIKRREEGAGCPRCQGRVKRIELGGRGTYFCPQCQV